VWHVDYLDQIGYRKHDYYRYAYVFTYAHSCVCETVLYSSGPVNEIAFVYEEQHLVEILCDDGLRK
jgi:hypothetical protein